jgi:repressor LexA
MQVKVGIIWDIFPQEAIMSRKRKKDRSRLSERQTNIIKFLHKFMTDQRYPPTIREIGAAVKISSTSVVNYNLNRLEDLGLISRDRTVSRGIRLLEPAWGLLKDAATAAQDLIQVPVLGRIVAGEPVPVPASDFEYMPDETISLARSIVRDADELYALQVQGDSMIDALINDGDIVIMRHQEKAENGELVAVWLRDREETTLKQFYLENGQVRLQPANPYMEPIYIDAENVEIQGKVVLVIRQLH